MSKITATDTLELSIPERIQLVEDIWDTITAKASSIELTDEEKRIIDARLMHGWKSISKILNLAPRGRMSTKES